MAKHPGIAFPFQGRGYVTPAVLLLLCWFCVIRVLWTDWRVDPQYGYGILVPLMIAGLLIARREDAPAPRPPAAGYRALGISGLLAFIVTLSLLVPMCVANPDWRPLGWLTSISVIAITLAVLYLAGGFPWLRHYSFPVLFFMIAVPWPRNAESAVMNFLMGWNTAVTLEILHWLGYEATGRGNLIQLPCGTLGIEEACSGIRSLQSGLMVALFAGEFFRLGMPRRLLLLGMALLAALLGNILRNAFLAIIASRNGLAAVTAWHDTAGYFILALTVGTVVLAAGIWGKHSRPNSSGALPVAMDATSPQTRTLPRIPLLLGCVILLLSLAGTELWFRAHESDEGGMTWDLGPRLASPGVSRVEVAPATLAMLLHPEGFSEKWIRPSGVSGQVFYFRWPPGRSSVQAMSMHNPEVCLGSIGMKLRARLGRFDCDGIPFDSLLFSQGAHTVYVFHARIREGERSSGSSEIFLDTPLERLGNLIAGRRNRGERMIEVALWNLPDEDSARRSLAAYLREATIRNSPTPSAPPPLTP